MMLIKREIEIVQSESYGDVFYVYLKEKYIDRDNIMYIATFNDKEKAEEFKRIANLYSTDLL